VEPDRQCMHSVTLHGTRQAVYV